MSGRGCSAGSERGKSGPALDAALGRATGLRVDAESHVADPDDRHDDFVIFAPPRNFYYARAIHSVIM